MSNEMEPLPLLCACGDGLVVTAPIVDRVQTWCLCGRCTAKHDTREDSIAEWNVIQVAIREHRKRKEMIEMMEAAIPDEGTDTQAEPLPCICGGGYVLSENGSHGWYGMCSIATCKMRTGFCATADDARKRWNTIQRALCPNAVTIELPELPEGYVWDRKTLMVTMTATREHPIPRCDIDIDAKLIVPTPAEIRERSQAWAAEQKPGTVARYGGVTWFWRHILDDISIENDGTLDGNSWWIYFRGWRAWHSELDGIGPEHVFTPSEAGEDQE